MRWSSQKPTALAADALPGFDSPDSALALSGLVRTVRPPEFAGLTFHEVLAKSALNRVPGGGGGLPFGWTINPYRGCSHACVYCFARPTHEYLDLDAGRDFDAQVVVKLNVAEVLARELARPSWQRDPVALGTNTDPYQRAEGRYALMPGIIEALAASGTPLSILTKGTLLRRDLPLLQSVGARSAVHSSLRLGPGVREWFFAWLEREHPDRVERYRALYSDGPHPPKAYRAWLAARVDEVRRAHGLRAPALDTATGTVRSTALAGPRQRAAASRRAVPPTPVAAPERPVAATLF